jgi:hypothetical protein
MRALKAREKRLLVYLAILIVVLSWDTVRRRWSPTVEIDTEHYRIYSTATADQTREIGCVAEIVYRGYRELLADLGWQVQPHPKLKIKLFKDREEFRFCNRVGGWAEGFYRRPYSHQYYAADEIHPYHWVMHEATHQLAAEVAQLAMPRWLDEGLACYVSTSRIIGDSLHLGEIDMNTCPVWWLYWTTLSQDVDADKNSGQIIPLRTILSGRGGPGIDKNANLYYLHWWSLVHFLIDYQDGRYRAGLAPLITDGATLSAFEKHIGNVEAVEKQWHAYLFALQKQLAGRGTPPVKLGLGTLSDSPGM